MGKCGCCGKEKPIVGVAAITGMPMSIAWCEDCLKVDIVPYWSAVSNTAVCDGWDNCAEWWQEIVKNTLEYFGKTRAEFEQDVTEDIKAMEKYFNEEDQDQVGSPSDFDTTVSTPAS